MPSCFIAVTEGPQPPTPLYYPINTPDRWARVLSIARATEFALQPSAGKRGRGAAPAAERPCQSLSVCTEQMRTANQALGARERDQHVLSQLLAAQERREVLQGGGHHRAVLEPAGAQLGGERLGLVENHLGKAGTVGGERGPDRLAHAGVCRDAADGEAESLAQFDEIREGDA